MELPFIKFYGRDWLGDSQLRLCSLAARGLWIDLIALMASSQRRGYLEIGGKPVCDAGTISRIVCADAAEVGKMLTELEQAGVFSRDESGTIYSRRMVRDAAVSEQKRAAGLQGGNPALVKQPVKRAVKLVVKHKDKRVLKPRDQRPETRNNVNLVNAADLTKLTFSKASADRIAKDISSDRQNWSYDNCKVLPANIVAASIKTILEQHADGLNEKQIHDCWREAVERSHRAAVDGLADDPAAYAVTCFKEQLSKAQRP